MKEKYRKYTFAIFLITISAVAVIFVAYALQHQCINKDWMNESCYFLTKEIFAPIFWSFLSLIPVTLVLFFVRRETFFLWAKFAVVAFPLMLGILLYTFQNESGGGSWVGGPTNAQFASFTLPAFFFLISLILIVYKSLKLRGQK